MSTLHLLIKGKVQGVFYRATAKEKAEECHVTGWVKNTATGNVETVVTGEEEKLQQFIQWCKQGPPRAEVTEVKISPIVEIAFEEFRIVK